MWWAIGSNGKYKDAAFIKHEESITREAAIIIDGSWIGIVTQLTVKRKELSFPNWS